MPTATRDEYVAGLRALADLIESTPGLPMPQYNVSVVGSVGVGSHDPEGEAESIERLALCGKLLDVDVLSEPVEQSVHHRLKRAFGPVELHLSYVEYGAQTTRAGDSDLAPEVPAVATTRPGHDVIPAGGEVADPTGVCGSATTPGDGRGAS